MNLIKAGNASAASNKISNAIRVECIASGTVASSPSGVLPDTSMRNPKE